MIACTFEDKCMFQYRFSYKHVKEISDTKEQEKLQDEIKTLRAEIDKLQKDNEVRITTLAKVHLKELDDLKRDNRPRMGARNSGAKETIEKTYRRQSICHLLV